MSRQRLVGWLVGGAAALATAAPAEAQDGATGSPPERIDIAIEPPPMSPTEEECQRQREAAIVSREIVVCGAAPGETSPRYSSKEDAQNRHAARTMGPAPVEVEGRGLIPVFGAGVVIRGCFIPPCPKPPALFIDVAALPKAPPGSDADRIARGLAPLEKDDVAPGSPTAGQRAELGLPEALASAMRPTAETVTAKAVPPEPEA